MRDQLGREKKISKMAAICGLVCSDYIAFDATQRNDDELRERVVKAWSTENERLRLEGVDCDGCKAGKRLHSFCRVCSVRRCCIERDLENCAYCNEFPCGKLEELWRTFRTVSGEKAKANLVEARKRISTTR